MTEREGAEKIAAVMREVQETGLNVSITTYGVCVSDRERSCATNGAAARWIRNRDLEVK